MYSVGECCEECGEDTKSEQKLWLETILEAKLSQGRFPKFVSEL